MPKTAVGLFENPGLVEGVVREIEALGFPRTEVRSLKEPADFDVTGVMSFPEDLTGQSLPIFEAG